MDRKDLEGSQQGERELLPPSSSGWTEEETENKRTDDASEKN
jgi:hypothetical protein